MDVRFAFRGAAGRLLLRAVDRRGGPFAGSVCPGSISLKGRLLAEDDLPARVSELVGVDLSANRQTLHNELAARRDVRMLLGLVRVPAGSRLQRSKISTQILPATADFGDRTWKVHLPLARVFAFEEMHRPRGASDYYSNGSGANRIGGRMWPDRGLSYDYPPRPGLISSHYLSLDFQALPNGWTRISAGVRTIWDLVRSPSEQVPNGVRAIEIHEPARLVRRITRPAAVARIVHWFDSLPVVQPGWSECGPMGASPRVRIDFLGAGNETLASAIADEAAAVAGYCNPLDFSVTGVREEALDGSGDPIGEIEKLAR